MTIQEILSGLAATNTNYAAELREEGFPQSAKLADMIIMGPAKINYREILKEMMRQRSDFTRDKCVSILKKLLNIHSSRKVVKSDRYALGDCSFCGNGEKVNTLENFLKKYGFDDIEAACDLLDIDPEEEVCEDCFKGWLPELNEAFYSEYDEFGIDARTSRNFPYRNQSKQIKSAKVEVDTDDLSEICIEDFFEPQGLDSIISILPVSDVTEDACLLIQDQLNRNGDFSNINVPEEILAQAQVIFDSADYDSVTVNLSSENYLIFKLDNPSVKAEEDSDIKLVAPEDTVVIETDDGDFLVKSKDSSFVEFIDEEMGDGTGDDEEMTEIVDGVNSSLNITLADPNFVKSSGYHYCLVNSRKESLLKNLLTNSSRSQINSSRDYPTEMNVYLDHHGTPSREFQWYDDFEDRGTFIYKGVAEDGDEVELEFYKGKVQFFRYANSTGKFDSENNAVSYDGSWYVEFDSDNFEEHRINFSLRLWV